MWNRAATHVTGAADYCAAAAVVPVGGAETRPSIRAVQRCFVRSNSISEEFLYRGPTAFPNRARGQRALRRLHKARNAHDTPGVWERTPHSSTRPTAWRGEDLKRAENTERPTGVTCEPRSFAQLSCVACCGEQVVPRSSAGRETLEHRTSSPELGHLKGLRSRWRSEDVPASRARVPDVETAAREATERTESGRVKRGNSGVRTE